MWALLIAVLLFGGSGLEAPSQKVSQAPTSPQPSTTPSATNRGTPSQVWLGGSNMFIGWLTLSVERSGAGSYDVVWDAYVGHIYKLHYDVEEVPAPSGEAVLLLSRNGKPCSFFKGNFNNAVLQLSVPKEEIPFAFALTTKGAVDAVLGFLRRQATQQAAFYVSKKDHDAPRDDSPTYNPDLVPTCK